MPSTDLTAARAIRDGWLAALPEGVALAVWGMDVDDSGLRVEDGRWVERAVEKRRVEFLRGRACARVALAAVGGPGDAELPVGPSRAPVWPEGFTGSITHAKGVVAAVVAPMAGCGGIGIDVERGAALPQGTERHVLLPEEIERLASPLDLVAFSAKESIFKAVHPVVERWIGFMEARIVLGGPGAFTVEWAKDPLPVPAERLTGWYATGEDWVARLVSYGADPSA